MAASINPTISATQKSERIALTGSGPQITQTWIVPSGGVSDFETAYQLGEPHGTYTTSKIVSRDKDHIDGEDGSQVLYKYVLTYARASASGTLGSRPAGTESRSGSANAVDIPIQRHPNRASFTTSKDGVDTYISPQPSYTHTEYVKAEDIADEDDNLLESEIIDNVGRRASQSTLATYGLSAPGDDGRWLMVDKRLEFLGDVWQVTRVWQYAENGWDSEIYPSESGAYS